MTSGIFHTVPINEIVVDREGRQRRDLGDIPVLADSIRRLGLIHPLVVTRELELVAGERRLAACRVLGWTQVPIQYVDELDPGQLQAIELEENIKRKDISWKEHVAAITKYHAFRTSQEKEWSEQRTAEAIGLSQSHVNSILLISEEMERGTPTVLAADKLSTASNAAQRSVDRRREAMTTNIYSGLRETFPSVALDPNRPEEIVLNVDFTEWVHTDIVPRFNLIHCDFPYGIEANTFNQGGASTHGGYIDTKEVWEGLIEALAVATKRITAPSCHLMFWFAMRKGDNRLYEPTVRALERIGWDINPMPLIWMKSDGVGIIPDPERGPRQIYETCLFGSRGDRKIVRSVANAYHAPTVRDKHMSEKPEPMLRHFFQMLVDENTVMLDPTCGSGSALRAAESLNAKYCLGCEINPEWAEMARRSIRQARTLREAQKTLAL